jgi:hypothetical protein
LSFFKKLKDLISSKVILTLGADINKEHEIRKRFNLLVDQLDVTYKLSSAEPNIQGYYGPKKARMLIDKALQTAKSADYVHLLLLLLLIHSLL